MNKNKLIIIHYSSFNSNFKMEIQNNNDKIKYQNYFAWINSFDLPLSKPCSSINDLKNGDIFLELLKYYFKYNKKNRNYMQLINSSNKEKNTLEKMQLIFQILSKITNNNKIKSRIETFQSNINEFLKKDDLIFEFLMYFMYIIEQNKNNNRICRMNAHHHKNNSCIQPEKKRNILNLENKDKHKKKIIDYKSIKDEKNNDKLQEVHNKNNFLFYINNENENIINIDNNMNFRFTNGISNLKAQNNNSQVTKEIKSYATKPKIIKYDSQYFNGYKDPIKNMSNKRITKSETCINNLKTFIKEEKKINCDENNETKNIDAISKDYYTYKPEKYNSVISIMKENNNSKKDIENNNEKKNLKKFELNKKNEIDLMNVIKNKRNSSTKNKTLEKRGYKLLKLTNSKINNSKEESESLKEEQMEQKKEKGNNLIYENEYHGAKSQKNLLNSRNKKFYKNKINGKSDKQILINNLGVTDTYEIKRQISNPKKLPEKQYTDITKFNNNTNKVTHKSHSYFKFNIPINIDENYNYNLNEKIHLNNINVKLKHRNREINKEKIFLWLYNLNLIDGSQTNIINLPQLISDGKLLCDIINLYEDKNNQIENISSEVSIKENALMNIKKALFFLNQIEDFPKDNISSYEPIFEIDSVIIWELLDDLYYYYSDKIDLKHLNIYNSKKIISRHNNDSNITNNRKPLKNFKKKNMSEISDVYFSINDIKNKNYSHKNNVKNILFKNIKNDKNENNKENITFNSNNNNTHYNYAHENISMINNKENITYNNNSNINIYEENESEYKKIINNKDKKKNYYYYVNAFKNYFDKEKESKEEFSKKGKTINSNKVKTEYKNDTYNPIDNINNLYFNYSNNTYFNKINKKSRYHFNPINPYYYKANKYSTLNNVISINKY